MIDLIPLIPLQYIFSHGSFNIKILYTPKVIRFLGGFEIFDIRQLNHLVNKWQNTYVISKIKKDPLVAEDQMNDHNKIEQQLLFIYIVKTLKLAFIILNFSYFLGMFWIVFCELDEYYYYESFFDMLRVWVDKQQGYFHDHKNFNVEDCYNSYGILSNGKISTTRTDIGCVTMLKYASSV